MKTLCVFALLILSSFAYPTDLPSKDYWLGHWEDKTGYWIDIQFDGMGMYEISRSGNKRGDVQLFFIELAENCNKFVYKERYPTGQGYIHSLEPINATAMREKWVSMADGSLWKIDTLYKK